MKWAPAFCALVCAACGPGAARPDAGENRQCANAFVGDEAAAPEVVLTTLGADNSTQPLDPGGKVQMLIPPQGGRVIFIGVRARNLAPCGVQLLGSLRDPASGEVRLDSRTVNLQPTSDGWAASQDGQIADFANVPVCPNQWSSKDLYDAPYEIAVTVTDGRKRSGQSTMQAVPTCVDGDAFCRCICGRDYVLGQSCAPDAGIRD